ncbi:MAG TPA: site-specific DNA-methyltransferase [Leptospiraceae bacterium]|nr:site-specific DNA-methyltransferase [Leptospiraceae bacterium]HMZ57214.1 site-specific DNA-methyltransferase [Leptospiraceae bacterium]HNF23125.1 site-specific DNA-methyltransferase [Leptospiraceae bacterium]HNI98285.1 site-specific DNA-methyltransferase [Leptospiraceae bacterium]HNM02638.1 site-specific DNA-methyltransferase [Leptospiraceae bacterium]
MKILPKIRENSVDTVFADPPFNIGKIYRKGTNDSRPDYDYIDWSKQWIRECVRVLKPGGSIFLYNLPKWNIIFGNYLLELGMDFRHWIAIELNMVLPIQGRLYPSHYSLLYYSKGKPNVFRKIRTPIEKCRHCGGEIKDYGGHRKAMNPNGVNLKDVWTDIPPVRHRKFKSKNRNANALSTKITDRIVEMSTLPGDIVLDPFGGSGTTFISCENKNRNWIGIEIDYCDDIKDRIESDDVIPHKNFDFIEG